MRSLMRSSKYVRNVFLLFSFSRLQTKTPIVAYIIQVILKYRKEQRGELKLVSLGRHNFFLKLGELINDARVDGTERGDYIQSFVEGWRSRARASERAAINTRALADNESWLDLTTSTLHSFAESNRSYLVNITTATVHSENSLIEIDEMASTMPSPVEAPTSPLNLCKIAE